MKETENKSELITFYFTEQDVRDYMETIAQYKLIMDIKEIKNFHTKVMGQFYAWWKRTGKGE